MGLKIGTDAKKRGFYEKSVETKVIGSSWVSPEDFNGVFVWGLTLHPQRQKRSLAESEVARCGVTSVAQKPWCREFWGHMTPKPGLM
ncbi:hypothetical protein [Microseira wollei]|uniref:Uncharacterized protein n=1 Tax=Microseira wollei NIES-4236 TaxID=2530354 RepID=A0AAV3XD25_9CYAN|nr:hypothetical protein [Microseira wollei]GET37990.1 hypothetical protein MiSe_27440 [Microseira wollei NIES-4236]